MPLLVLLNGARWKAVRKFATAPLATKTVYNISEMIRKEAEDVFEVATS